MITNKAIAKAIGQRLWLLSPSLHTFRVNNDVPAGQARPYLIFDHVPVSRTDDTLKGGSEIVTGFAQVTVMSEIGVGDDAANDIADSIAALFPYALRLAVTGGTITINKPPEVQRGYPDTPHWRVPVKISYSAS